MRPRIRRNFSLYGKKFGNLTVLGRSKDPSPRGYLRWHCRCTCGQEIDVDSDRLRDEKKLSCGINAHYLKKKSMLARPKIPSHLRVEYQAWQRMMGRCYDEKRDRYKDYGGRGIKVEERWHQFANFIADICPKPASWLSLDRKRVNENYGPDNCQWSSPLAQARNQRRTVFVDYKGQRVTLAELIVNSGLSHGTVWIRLRWGWPLEEALTISPRTARPSKRETTPMYLTNMPAEQK